MRNRPLHDALRDFAVESAAFLSTELERGAELAFEVGEQPGSGAPLYRYRPLTDQFIAARWPALRALPSAEPAARALGTGALVYLRICGRDGADAEPALRAMLERLYDDLTSFGFPEERFERVYAEVERSLYEGTVRSVVLAPLHGVRLDMERGELGGGLALVRGDAIAAPRESVWRGRAAGGERTEPNTLCVLELDVAAGDQAPLDEARARFAGLLTALRLHRSGGVALSTLGWARLDEQAWQPVALDATGYARGEERRMHGGELADVRELLEIVEGSRPVGALEWALGRFEMGCERARDVEALSDYLLALRALLDAGDELGRASCGLRLAALCAEEPARREVRRRVEAAFALERLLIAGGSGEDYVDELGGESPHSLAFTMEEHLRALIRDVVCGYLEPNLRVTADEILLEGSEPIDIRAHDLRADPHAADPYVEEGETTEEWDALRELASLDGAEPAAAVDEHHLRAEPRETPVTTEHAQAPEDAPAPEGAQAPENVKALEGGPRPWRATAGLSRRRPPDPRRTGVTPSADWDFDDDPSGYGTPL